MTDILLICLAIIAFLGIILEDVIHISKAKSALFCGTLAWIILYIQTGQSGELQGLQHKLLENLSEISTLWLFLLAAMTFVAYMNKKKLIESWLNALLPDQLSTKMLIFFTATFAFTFSLLADNITATLISIALIQSLGLTTQQKIKFALIIVFAVNSGGVSLITGDVTTLMIFMQNKVSIGNLLWLLMPAFCAVMVLAFVASKGIAGTVKFKHNDFDTKRVDIYIAAVFFSTIVLTVILNLLFSIPPVLTFLFGLSVMFLMVSKWRDFNERDPILEYIRYIEFETLLFFLGVLLLIGALEYLHLLDVFLKIYEFMPVIFANFVMGVLSAIVDNVPLTAALLKAEISMSTVEWMLFTYAVGVGGSLLVIGSSAGIVAMSKIKELNFFQYGRFFFLLLFAYTIGYALVFLLAVLTVGNGDFASYLNFGT